MRIFPLLVSLAVLSSLPAQRPEKGGKRDSAPIELTNFTFQVKSFKSAALDRDVPYGIYLPKGYEDEARAKTTYPLVIWLHGMREDHMRFHNRGMGAPILDKVTSDGKLPPCVFVLANSGAGQRVTYLNQGKGADYEDLITKDLVEHITATYRVSKERGQRALMGISMGGMGALRIGFTRPELFGTVAVHSSAVLPEDPSKLQGQRKQMAQDLGLTDPDKWKFVNPLNLAEEADPKKLKGLRLYFDAGTNDYYQFGEPNQQMHEVLDKRKVAHTFELVQGGGHSWGSGFKEESLIKSLTFVGEGFGAGRAVDHGKDALKGLLGGDKGDARPEPAKGGEPGKG